MPIDRDPTAGTPEDLSQRPDGREAARRQEALTLAAALGQPETSRRENLPIEARLIEAVSFLRGLDGAVARGILITMALEHPQIGAQIEKMAREVAQQKREQRKDVEVDALLEEAKRQGCHPAGLLGKAMELLKEGDDLLMRWERFQGRTVKLNGAPRHDIREIMGGLNDLDRRAGNKHATAVFIKRLIVREFPEHKEAFQRFFEEAAPDLMEVEGGAKVFLSYARADLEDPVTSDFINRLKRIEGVKILQDVDSIKSMDDFRRRILELIAQSDRAIVLLSSNAIKTDWILEEIRQSEMHGLDIVPIIRENPRGPVADIQRLQAILSHIGSIQAVDARGELGNEALQTLGKVLPLNSGERSDRFYRT